MRMKEWGFSPFSLFMVIALSDSLLMSGFGYDLLHDVNSMQSQPINRHVISLYHVYSWYLIFMTFQTQLGQPSVLWGSGSHIWIGTMSILYWPAYVAVWHFDCFWSHPSSGSSNPLDNGVYYCCLIVCTWDRRRRRDHDHRPTKPMTLSVWALLV